MDGSKSNGVQMVGHSTETVHYHLPNTGTGHYHLRNERTGYYHLPNTGTGHYHLRNERTGHYHPMKLSNGENNNGRETENTDMSVYHDVPSIDRSAEISNGETSLYKSRIVLDAHITKPPQITYSEESPSDKGESDEERENKIYEGSVEMDNHSNTKQLYKTFNTRALPKNATTYQLETFEKHALLIFIQTRIKKCNSRLDTVKDVTVLQNTFRKYGFEVQIEKDLTKQEIMTKIKEFSSLDFTDYGCVAVAVLTHGSKHGFISAMDEEFSQLEIVKHLQVQNKPTLVTKPKLMIIEACRGIVEETATMVAHDTIARRSVELSQSYTMPSESDLLVVHSSYIGTHCADRKIISGAWFIQSLCTKIQELASTLDFESILTEVKREALERFNIEYNKQMPVTTSSTLTRKLHLFIKNAPKLTSSAKTALLSNISVLDRSMPKLPLFVKFGPCSCFLEHYSYITKCLQYFLEDHPDDTTAKSLLDVASTFDKGVGFNNSKERMAKAICDYLKNVASDRPFSKYLFFYKH